MTDAGRRTPDAVRIGRSFPRVPKYRNRHWLLFLRVRTKQNKTKNKIGSLPRVKNAFRYPNVIRLWQGVSA